MLDRTLFLSHNSNTKTMKENQKLNVPFVVKDLIDYAEGSVVSRQLIKQVGGNITLFAFEQGEQLSEHTAPFDAMCQVLDGEVQIRIDQTSYDVGAGETIVMPAHVPHALYAKSRFKMLLTMIKGN